MVLNAAVIEQRVLESLSWQRRPESAVSMARRTRAMLRIRSDPPCGCVFVVLHERSAPSAMLVSAVELACLRFRLAQYKADPARMRTSEDNA